MDNTKKPMSQRIPLPACSFSPNNAAVNKIASVDATIPGVPERRARPQSLILRRCEHGYVCTSVEV